jgi:hypothetical protein
LLHVFALGSARKCAESMVSRASWQASQLHIHSLLGGVNFDFRKDAFVYLNVAIRRLG